MNFEVLFWNKSAFDDLKLNFNVVMYSISLHIYYFGERDISKITLNDLQVKLKESKKFYSQEN